MTRNEMLDELSVLHERFKNGMGWRDGNYEEALDKAIEILEQAEQTETSTNDEKLQSGVELRQTERSEE